MIKYVCLLSGLLLCPGCVANNNLASTYTVQTADGRVFTGLSHRTNYRSSQEFSDSTGRAYLFSGSFTMIQELAYKPGE